MRAYARGWVRVAAGRGRLPASPIAGDLIDELARELFPLSVPSPSKHSWRKPCSDAGLRALVRAWSELAAC